LHLRREEGLPKECRKGRVRKNEDGFKGLLIRFRLEFGQLISNESESALASAEINVMIVPWQYLTVKHYETF